VIPSRRRTSLLIAGFLAVQAIYPIRGLVEDKFASWGEFTWNMYSQTYKCLTRYQLVDRSGARVELDLKPYFADRSKVGRVFNRGDLPVFHRFLCAQMAREGRAGPILARVSCTWNEVETRPLVRENQDICAAADAGVLAS
jgi:hypothetical protein